mmetsp:Transcript_19885/g.30622  ORF Transcript_19885/g.30622 Transcript_19885/m.30622 type:complete len:113 (+) Transcript_19885:1773-2111(+)
MEEVKRVANDPFHMMRLKPLGYIASEINAQAALGRKINLNDDSPQSKFMDKLTAIRDGDYFYLPVFQDCRLYRYQAGQGGRNFEVACSSLAEVQGFLAKIRQLIEFTEQNQE